MKNVSSFVYLKKNTPFFQNQSVFKPCVQKNELNVRSFQNFTALLPFQFLKSSFQKKQKHLSMSPTLFLTKKMKKTKDFCFFILFEFFFLCGTYAEKLQCFDKLFFPHFFSLFVQKRVLEIEKNEHTSKRSFLVSVISFFFFFLFEKQVHSFPKKRSQKTLSLTHVPDLIWKRFFLKSLFFFFESVFKHFHTFLSSFFCLSKKKDFFKVFLKHFQFWSSFPDLSVVFPFLSRGFPSSFSYPVFRQKCEISEDQTKKTVLHSFFCLFSEQKPHIESFFRPFERVPSWFFEKKSIQKKNSCVSFQIFNFFRFPDGTFSQRFSFFSKKSRFSFWETTENRTLQFKTNTLQTNESLMLQQNSSHFLVFQAFQKSFFQNFLSCPERLFEKMALLFLANAKRDAFFSFEKIHHSQHLFFAFRSLSEKTRFRFVHTKILLCFLCRQFFEQCFFWKFHTFCLFSPKKFSQNFENFFVVFFKIHEMFQSHFRFHFFQKEKTKNVFFPFPFFSSVFFSRHFSLRETIFFQKNGLFFPKKSLFAFGKTHFKTYDSFSFFFSVFTFFRFLKKKRGNTKRHNLFFSPEQKTFFPFRFEKSLFFLFCQLHPSFQKIFSVGKIPHRDEVRAHLHECQKYILQSRGKSQLVLMKELQRKISVWWKTKNSFFLKEIFEYCDSVLLKSLWKWAQRRHPNKNKIWIQKKYFHSVVFNSKKKWLFGKKMHQFLTCVPLHSYLEGVHEIREPFFLKDEIFSHFS